MANWVIGGTQPNAYSQPAPMQTAQAQAPVDPVEYYRAKGYTPEQLEKVRRVGAYDQAMGQMVQKYGTDSIPRPELEATFASLYGSSPKMGIGGGFTIGGNDTVTGIGGNSGWNPFGSSNGLHGGGSLASPMSGAYPMNPYLPYMADDMQRRTQQGLGQAFNGIRSNAVGVGGLGGSRQGVAEGVATGQAMDALQGNLAGLYGGAWNQDQNRFLQKYGMDQQNTLGWGGLANQRYGMDQNYDLGQTGMRNSFYLGNRAADDQDRRTGMSMYNLGSQGEWNPLNNAANLYQPFTGYGTTSSGGGSNWQSILGGLWGGAKFGKDMGWWG